MNNVWLGRALQLSIRLGQLVPFAAILGIALHLVGPTLAIELVLTAWAMMFALCFVSIFNVPEVRFAGTRLSRTDRVGCFWTLATFFALGFLVMFCVLFLVIFGVV
jgi:hypothetical protein